MKKHLQKSNENFETEGNGKPCVALFKEKSCHPTQHHHQKGVTRKMKNMEEKTESDNIKHSDLEKYINWFEKMLKLEDCND